ncbi:MAG: glycosyltransferase family 4 protein [Mesorhizobium sp.]|nr:glycosyltransferase family 4 protein [Mesorhizobium sp.]
MTTSLRIVHCFRSPVGGIFRHVRDLTEYQVAAGHKVGIVCGSTTGGEYEDGLIAQIRDKLELGVRRTPIQRHIGPGDVFDAVKTYSIIKELQPDILHGHGAKGGLYSRLFGSLLRVFRSRVSRVYSPHGGSLHYDEDTTTGRLIFGAERVLDRCTDHILFVSAYEQEIFRRKVGVPRAPSSLVYNGLRSEEFEPVAPVQGAADFLYIGMMRDLKGPDLFIDALATAEAATGRRLAAVMIGDGDDLPSYRAQVARLGLADRVTFRPAMPARQAFALARNIVVPSRAEAMPYIVLEALAAGMPMIATAVGGIPEVFAAGSPALVAPDAAAIAGKMTDLLGDEAAWRALMPDAASLRARFGADVMARGVEQAYFAARARSA